MRLLLVRHALCDPVGVALSGRRPGVSLNQAGRTQLPGLVARVARRLAGAPLAAVLASPLARAQETAAALAAAHGLPVGVEPGLVEFDFGRWSGERIDALDAPNADPAWRHFNAYRSGTRAPGGELALEAQARAVGAALRLAAAYEDAGPEARVAAVSHADVIKAVLGHLLGVPLDLQHRLEVAPASVAEVELRPWGARVLAVNDVG